MSNHWHFRLIFLLHILNLVFCVCVLCATEEIPDKKYLKIEQKLKTTTDPISKAKILIQMADFQLRGAAHQVKKSNFTEADQYLARYRAIIRQTQEILESSGRNAQKNPAGFKDFEIALRKQLRRLDDLRPDYPYEQAQKLDETIEEAKAVKESMLVQIFGAGNFGKRKEDK
jgi:hypothetical protein